jgi:hypothetical protein
MFGGKCFSKKSTLIFNKLRRSLGTGWKPFGYLHELICFQSRPSFYFLGRFKKDSIFFSFSLHFSSVFISIFLFFLGLQARLIYSTSRNGRLSEENVAVFLWSFWNKHHFEFWVFFVKVIIQLKFFKSGFLKLFHTNNYTQIPNTLS